MMTSVSDSWLRKKMATLANSWPTFSLARQFAIISTIVLLAGMAIIGSWVAGKIEASVTQNTATATALFMDSFVAPRAQELATKNVLTPANQRSLNDILTSTAIGNRIASFKIWKEGGLIAFSSRPSIIGKVYPPTDHLKLAWTGVVTAEFDSLDDEEDEAERADGVPFLEMYSPIREEYTGRIIAVAEFYERADLLQKDLFQAKLQSWLIVATVTAAMLGSLFILVRRGSQTIEDQQLALEKRIAEQSELRNRLRDASRRSAELNERFLRRLGSDLHDGPAQLLGLALLRLDALKPFATAKNETLEDDGDDLAIIQNALDEALTEIRNISSGVVLPELEDMKLADIIKKVVTEHERRTGKTVTMKLSGLPDRIGISISICLYRLVQEGLNNAQRHAPNATCSIVARHRNHAIELEVRDSGPGFDITAAATSDPGLGLPGLRERVESLGGTFEVSSSPSGGTRLTARFASADTEIENGG